MNSRAIINCAIGWDYPRLQQQLIAACLQHCHETPRVFYQNRYPEGCPPHDRQNYAFKVFAWLGGLAIGASRILWLDCTFRPCASLEPIWEEIEQEGWYVPPQLDARLGRWCSDHALKIFGISRETAMQIPLVFSGVVGLDLGSVTGRLIYNVWWDLYRRGAFNGAHKAKMNAPLTQWGNKWEGHVSDDPTVEGHRHDEAALSFVLWKLGLTPPGRGFLTVEDPAGCIERNFLPCP